MPSPFHPQPRVGHPLHSDPTFVPGCPVCEAALQMFSIEDDLRDLSVDLWVGGWTPTQLVDHVRNEVADLRGAELVARGILFEDATRADQARPAAWRRDVSHLQREFGVNERALRSGWLLDWVVANSECDRVGSIATVIEETMVVLSGLPRPTR